MENNYRLGLVSISFRQNSPREILEAMKKAGLSYIEWGSDIHAPCTDKERLFELRSMMDEYGISCSSYGTYFRFLETPVEELENYIEAAKILGTDILRLWCGRKSGAVLSPARREMLFEECRAAEKIAARHGVKLCMECHKNTFTERLEDALLLMEKMNSPHFLMYWQPFVALSPEENLKIAKALSPYTTHLHVFHWVEGERLSLADGIEVWREYLKEFSTPRTLLLEFMPDNNIESLPHEAEALRKIVEA